MKHAFQLVLGLLLPAALLAQNPKVTVNASQSVRTVDERVFGLNATLWDPQAASAETISLVQAAGVRAIRVPGGSLSDEYHWRLNKSIDPANPGQNNTWTWSTGFDGFVKLITGVDTQAYVTVNYGTGTPEEAAAWVAYTNASDAATPNTLSVSIGPDAKGYDWQTVATWANLRAATPLATDDGMNFLRIGRSAAIGVKYWEIGNECYGTWETDEQHLPHDPTTYANRAKDYITKMKAVDPTIKVGVVVVLSTDPSGWTKTMLTRLKTLNVTPDFVIYHRYEQAPAADQPNNPETDAGLLQKAKTWPADAADLRQQVNSAFGTAGPGIEIVVTENNSVYAKPGKQTTSLVNGLYYADSVGNVLQTEINALVWWDLRNGQDFANNNSSSLYGWRNYGDYGILSTPAPTGTTGGSSGYYDAYPTYYVIKLLANFARQGDTIVQATSDNPLLAVFAAKRSNGGLRLLFINKDPTNTLTAVVALQNFSAATAASVYSYGITQDDAAKPKGTGSQDVATSTMNVAAAGFSAALAPYSATVIALSPAAASTTPPTTSDPNLPGPVATPSGGGGGGGALSDWFLAALSLLALARWSTRRSSHC